MDYQIAYLNVYGNAGVLVDEIQTILAGAELVDLNKQEISDDADVYLLVFEITQAAIPLKIMLEAFQHSMNHPDTDDLRELRRFIQESGI